MPEPSTSNSNDGNGQKPAIKLKFKPKEDAATPSQPASAPPPPPADAGRKGLSIKRPPAGAAPAAPAGAVAPATPAAPVPPPPPSIPKPSLSTAPAPAAPTAAGPIPPPNLSGPKPPPGVKLVPTAMPEEAAPSGPKIKLSFTSPKRQDLPPEQSGAASPKQSTSKAKGAPSVGPSTAPAQKQLNPLILIGAFAAIVIILLGGMFVLLLLKPAPEVPVAPSAPAPAAPAATATIAAPVPEEVVLTGSTATTVEAPEIEIPSTPEAFVASLSPSLLNAESGIALVIDDVIYPANTIIEPELGVRFAGFRESSNEAVFQDAKGNTLTRKF